MADMKTFSGRDRYRLLVFDWDGTLMDSEARIVKCVQSAIEAVGAASRSEAEIRNIIGLGLTEAVLTLYPDRDEVFVAHITAAYREVFLYRDETPSPMFEGVREVLRFLTEQDYLLAIATGKSRAGLERELLDSGLDGVFGASRCADEAHSKPHPGMMHEIMDELEVEPSRSLMIGDTEYDIRMAFSAGASALAVSYGVHEVERLMRLEPTGMIDRISDLPAWLGHR
ncbi:MAG: HAD-IA family hydrolase [Pseudomonadota bacterium]|nr:HAD-IA family hydrolase [Pseudomonadota bacterium]